MNGLTPQTREEAILNTLLSAAGGETVNDLTAETRREQWYQNILDAIKGNNLTYTLNAEMRREEWLEDFIEAAQEGGGGGAWDKEPPDDGKTRIYIDLPEGALEPYIGLKIDGEVDIDWGDGSDADTLEGTSTSTRKTLKHTYAAAGKYIITLDPGMITDIVLDGSTGSGDTYGSRILCYGTSDSATNAIFRNAIRKVYVNSADIVLGTAAFRYCTGLLEVHILDTTNESIPENAFYGCYSLQKIDISSLVASSITEIEKSSFTYVRGGCSFTIPKNVTSIGQYAFQNSSLMELHFKPTTPPTAGASAFASLSVNCKIYVPTGKLSEYTGASNYPSSSTYTYVEE